MYCSCVQQEVVQIAVVMVETSEQVVVGVKGKTGDDETSVLVEARSKVKESSVWVGRRVGQGTRQKMR
jgi:hypothetical protein